MTEVAPISASTRTVDDVFQILVARGVQRLRAKRRITKALQLGKLMIDFHIEAGARKTRPMRQATPEELKAKQEGAELDFLYEQSPPDGIAGPVDPQSWDPDSVFSLVIRNGRLLVEPNCSLDFPWSAYSFSIANPVVIDHLWPPPVSPPKALERSQPLEIPEPPRRRIPAKSWLFTHFGDHPCRPGMDEKTYLDDAYDRMKKDPKVRVGTRKAVYNRVREWQSTPKTKSSPK